MFPSPLRRDLVQKRPSMGEFNGPMTPAGGSFVLNICTSFTVLGLEVLNILGQN